ncbi:MAG TPA: DegT/DnrJ/EryC1/StrS family aminotransferase [Dehalococcoidia bacterium]|nr:DegT/DnrJ/EryC1/StrS family aminotransferase [Dehalococcoidia bacterium]
MIKVSRACLGEEELAQVKEAFDYGYFGLATKVDEFEEALKKYLGAKYVIATSNGTAALHLAMDAAGIGRGDEVIVPSLTFVGSFQAVSATGATPVPCDVYPDTLLTDIDDVKRCITPRTRAIMPVHYASNPCDMEALLDIAAEDKIRIIEDAAHALGSLYHGKMIGSFGDIACFSFDSIKNITCGEGGAVVTGDGKLDNLVRQKRLLGMDRPSQTGLWKDRASFYEVRTQGYRYHMSNINAAIGLAQLAKLDRFIARRKEICRRYNESFRCHPLIQCLNIDYDSVAPHIYVIRVKDGRRDYLVDYLKERDIETGINYIPNHLHAFYRQPQRDLPQTEQAYQEILTLPLHCGLTDEDVSQVISGVINGLSS